MARRGRVGLPLAAPVTESGKLISLQCGAKKVIPYRFVWHSLNDRPDFWREVWCNLSHIKLLIRTSKAKRSLATLKPICDDDDFDDDDDHSSTPRFLCRSKITGFYSSGILTCKVFACSACSRCNSWINFSFFCTLSFSCLLSSLMS